MVGKRRRQRRRSQHGKGLGSLAAGAAAAGITGASSLIPGLSKGKKGHSTNKVSAASKAALAGSLAIGLLGGPLAFGSQLLLNGSKIGKLLGTNYEGPVTVPKYNYVHLGNQYGWGFLYGDPSAAGTYRRRRRRQKN